MRTPVQRPQRRANPFGEFTAEPAAMDPSIQDYSQRAASFLSAPWIKQQQQDAADVLKAQQDQAAMQQRDTQSQFGDPNYRQSFEGYGGGSGKGSGYGSAAGGSGGGSGLAGLLMKHEGAGNASTLFGHSQNGGKFSGVDVSKMTLGQVKEFSRPDGEYGQWVKEQVGRVATPMGYGQIVGTTLRNTAQALGLPDDTIFNQDTQTRMVDYLAAQRIKGANSAEGRRAGMRAEWEGFKNVPNHILDQTINEFINNGYSSTPRQQPRQAGYANQFSNYSMGR